MLFDVYMPIFGGICLTFAAIIQYLATQKR